MRYEKSGLPFLVVLSLIIVTPNLTLAETSLDLYLGAAITQEEDVTLRSEGDPDQKLEVDWDTSITGGGRFGYWFAAIPGLGIAVDGSYFAPEEKWFEVDIFVLSALVMYRHPEGRFHPYIGIGPALFYSKIKVDMGGGRQDFKDGDFDSGLDSKVGLSIDIKEDIGIFAEYRFTYFKPEYSDSISGKNIGVEPEFYTHHLLLGVSFRF